MTLYLCFMIVEWMIVSASEWVNELGGNCLLTSLMKELFVWTGFEGSFVCFFLDIEGDFGKQIWTMLGVLCLNHCTSEN